MIGQILTDIILGDASVTGMIEYTEDGNTKYAFNPNVVPQGVPLPALSYKVLSIDTASTKDDEDTGIKKFRVQIDAFSKNYATLNKLDGAVEHAMDAGEGVYTVTDYDDSSIQVDVGVSRHEETTDVFFDEAETHGRSTEYFIIINKNP